MHIGGNSLMNTGHQLVDIQAINSRILLDIKYATADNFVNKAIYERVGAYLQEDVARKLDQVQQYLEKQGLGLKVWDAYRPVSVQRALWAIVPDERYVAHPDKGSNHNRGAAVDVTLVSAAGYELNMPTGFDDFTERAHYTYQDLEPAQIKNRAFLCDVMTAHGFQPLETEWWHFNDNNAHQYSVLDIPFEELL